MVRARRGFRFPLAGRRFRNAGAGSHGGGRAGDDIEPSALPEVAGDAALLVDPESGEALGQALRELTRTWICAGNWSRRGTERARMFTWEKAVRGNVGRVSGSLGLRAAAGAQRFSSSTAILRARRKR